MNFIKGLVLLFVGLSLVVSDFTNSMSLAMVVYAVGGVLSYKGLRTILNPQRTEEVSH